MRKIRLSNGQEFQVSRCGATEEILTITVTDGNLLDLVMVFGHPENVQTIEHWFEGNVPNRMVFVNYTELRMASQRRNGVTMLLYKQ